MKGENVLRNNSRVQVVNTFFEQPLTVSDYLFCALLEGRTLTNLASVFYDRAGDDTSYINALNPSIIRRRETSRLIIFDESHMPLQREYLLVKLYMSR